MVYKRDEAHTAEDRLDTDLVALGEHISSHATGQSELRDAPDASSQFGARWNSSGHHAKATERHFTHIAQQLTVVQVKLTHKDRVIGRLRWRC